MSDFDPDAYLADKARRPFDPDAYLADKLPQAEIEAPGALRTFALGASQGGTQRFADELGGLVGKSLLPRALALGKASKLSPDDTPEVRAAKMEALTNQAAQPTNFQLVRDGIRQEAERGKDAHGGAYLMGDVLGGAGAVTALNLMFPGAGSALGAIGQGALFGGASGLGGSTAELTKGDPSEIAHAAADTGIAAALGGATAYGAGKVLEKAVPWAAGKVDSALQGIARNRTISSLGPMLKGMRELAHRGDMNDLADTLLENKLVPWGGDADSVAKTVRPALDETGKRIGGRLAAAQEVVDALPEVAGSPDMTPGVGVGDEAGAPIWRPGVRPSELAKDIEDKVIKPIASMPPLRNATATLQREAQDIAKMGNRLSFEQAQNLKGAYGDSLKWDKEQTIPSEKLKQLYGVLNKHTEDAFGEAMGPEELAKYVGDKKLYGQLATAAKLSEDKGRRELANRIISPSDYATGLAGAVAGGEEPIKGGLTATMLALAHKMVRERGSSATAVTANTLRKLPNALRSIRGTEYLPSPAQLMGAGSRAMEPSFEEKLLPLFADDKDAETKAQIAALRNR